MRYAVDLHIHSALSPCADNDMTPNNIINMARLKGLDIIAVIDHNSAGNVKAFIECAAGSDILIVPGMELETREEVHLVCLLPDEKRALEMQKIVYGSMPYMPNREDIFGQQFLLDKDDNIVGSVEQMLVRAADIGIEEAVKIVRSLGGVAIPAHVDRNSYSIISNLGTVPDTLEVTYLEISHTCNTQDFFRSNPGLERYNFIRNSDAHRLGDILERESYIDLDEKSVQNLIDKLRA